MSSPFFLRARTTFVARFDRRVPRLLFAVASFALLCACGGGGGGGGSSSPAAAVATPASTATTNVATGAASSAASSGADPTASSSTPGSGASTTSTSTQAMSTQTSTSGSSQSTTTSTSQPDTTTTATQAAASPPVITTQPLSITVAGGQSASFTVVATSADTPTYRWTRNGVAIAGATSATYTAAAVQLSDSGASFVAQVTNAAGTAASTAARLTVNAVAAQQATAARPFSDQSPWNSRPTKFTLGTAQVPTSYYYPTVADGAYSVTGFVASNSDPSMAVAGPSGGSGIYIADAETYVPQIVIPHWPAGVAGASGTDGHADIIDVANNKIHSFWQLRQANGQWTAVQYTWTTLDGRGWGTPAEYMEGSRATGVPTIAGVIRVAEINDGAASYKHALAMSMPSNALSPSPAYIFPATTADINAYQNTGTIPEGALMMLPATFDVSKIQNPDLAKVARTLMSFGAYVVDQNYGTPYVIYVENGGNYSLMPNGWDNEVASELDLIRQQLRQVTQVSEWVDATGAVFTPEHNLNLLSMRGSWYVLSGTTAGVFDTYQQAVVFPDNGQPVLQINSSGRSIPTVGWAAPQPGETFKLVVTASGGASLRLQLLNAGGNLVDSGFLVDGQTLTFQWPNTTDVWVYVVVSSGAQGGGKVSATLIKQGS